jgi:hypothetical protein
MKKTYRELTPLEALKRMAEAGGPVSGLYIKADNWIECELCAVDLSATTLPFYTDIENDESMNCWHSKCAELIESAPEPWDFDSVPAQFTWLRWKVGGEANYAITSVRSGMITLSGYGTVLFTELPNWEHSFDRKTWLPCTK